MSQSLPGATLTKIAIPPTTCARQPSALLSCHPRSTSPCALPITFGPAKTSDGLQRNAISIIGTAAGLIDARTVLRHAASAQTDSFLTAHPTTISRANWTLIDGRPASSRAARQRAELAARERRGWRHKFRRPGVRDQEPAQAQLRTPAFLLEAVDPWPGAAHNVLDPHCRRRGIQTSRNGRAVHGGMRHLPRCYRADQMDRCPTRIGRLTQPRSVA